MTINYTTLLGLAQPVTGTETGQWGDVVNDEITSLLEDAVANAATFSVTSGNVTLTTTNGASNQARMSTLIITGSPGTTRNVIAPSQAKIYQVINQSDGAVVIKGSATTGVTIAAGATGTVVWNGSDFVEVNSTSSGRIIKGNLQVTGNLQVDGNTQLGNSTSDTLAVTALVNSNLLFTDNTYDIGASGANRPRTLYLGTSLISPAITNSGLTSGRVVYSTTGGAQTDSANLLYSGTDLTVYGITVGRGGGAINTNTAVGASALVANTTGATNVAIGASALAANTTGSGNTAVGREAMVYTTTGNNNSVLGTNALWTNTTGSQNTAIGWSALFSSTTASNNVAVGWNSAYNNTTGIQNTAVGSEALRTNATGSYNTALGYYALRNNTASGNTSLGYSTLSANTTGIENVAVGGSGIAISTMSNNTTGSYNVAVGNGALANNTTASSNTAVGYQAAYSNTTGTANTLIGRSAGSNLTTGNDNTAVGYGSLNGASGSGNNNAAFGEFALGVNTSGGNNTAIGTSSLQSNTTASGNTAVGYQAGYNNTTGTDNLFVGSQAGLINTTGNALTFIGWNAGYSNTTGSSNVAVGLQALVSNTTASFNVAVGREALRSNTTGATNSALGHATLYTNTTGANNVAVGTQALASNTTASGNTAVGYQAGYSNTTGAANTFLGNLSGYAVTTSNGQTFIGSGAGVSKTTGGNNTFVGASAGASATTGTGNTFVGVNDSTSGAGFAVTTGSKNTIIGGYTGNQGGLDIRTANNYIVLSDGDGNPKGYFDANGSFVVSSGVNKGIQILGNGYTIGTAGLSMGQYTSTRVYIQMPPSGQLEIWKSTTSEVTTFRDNGTVQFTNAISVGNATPTTSGSGVTFPASQAASSDANTLDDYEEGTWTPSFYGSSTAGTQAQITRSGTYVKIGRFVYCTANLAGYTLTGAAGNITMSGLPFTMDTMGGMSVYLEGIDPVYSGTPDNNITLGLRFGGSTQMFLGPTVSNGWDSYMTGSTTWTGGGGSTYGTISFWGIASA